MKLIKDKGSSNLKILIHASERRYLQNNVTVLKELKNKGHDLLVLLHLHDIQANRGTADEYRKMGFSVLNGPEMMAYTGEDAPAIIGRFRPDIFLPVEPAIYSWIKMHKHFRSKFSQIPIVSIQNSFGGLSEEEYKDIKREGGWYVDYHCCWGTQQVARNAAYGFPKERMIVTGNPAWDKYYQAQTEDQGYVLFIAGTGFDYLKLIKMDKIYQDFPKLSWVFKEHPNHERFFQNTCILAGKPRTKIIYDAPIQKLLRCAKVVVSSTSTCGVDAMLLNKPTIILNIGDNTKKFETCGRMIKPTYENFKAELTRCLNREEERSQVPAFLSSISHVNDGQATRRIVEVIEKIGQGEGI